MALEPVCQNCRPASCAVDKWIQYTASCSGPPMNVKLYFSWLRSICNRFCFICIDVEMIKRSEEDCLSSFFTFISSCHKSNFCNGVLISCLTHVINKSLPFLKESSRNSSVWVRWSFHLSDLGSHEYILILHVHLLQISNLVLMLPRLRQWSQSSSVNSFSSWFRNHPFHTKSTPHQCLAPSVSLFHLGVETIFATLGDASLKWIPFAFRASKNYSPNSVLLEDLFLHVLFGPKTNSNDFGGFWN